jgi:hypothetical protein
MYVYLSIESEVAGLACNYDLSILELAPTSTPTPGPTNTPQPTPTPSDEYEPNDSFSQANELAMGFTLNGAIGEGDNDFYKFYLEYGVRYRCDVTPQGNLDPNLIVYDSNQQGIGGNNNTSPDDPTSSFSWVSSYEGWSYLLVGPVAGAGDYTLSCEAVLPTATPTAEPYTGPGVPQGTPGPTATAPTIPTATKAPWERETTPGASPTPGPSPTVGPSPTLGPSPTPAPPVRVVVYYDKNDNGYPEPDEGIVGAVVLLLDVSTNKPVAFEQTDASGFAEITIPPANAIFQAFRITVPFLGFSKPASPGQRIEVEIQAQRLPGLIP